MVAYFLQKIELWYPRCRLQDIDFDLGCLMQVSFLPLWVGSRAASLSVFIFWGIPSIHPPTRSFRFHKLCVMAASSPSLHYSQELLQCTDCVPMWLVRTKPFCEALPKGDLLGMFLGNSTHPLPGRSNFLRASMGWKCGCQPFSCPCSQMWRSAKRRFVGHVKMSIHSLHSFLECII